MLTQYLESGTLLHPLADERNSIDLFRAISRLSGAHKIPDSEGVREIEDAIGPYDHYLFVLVDGLGMSQMMNWPNGGFFKSTFRLELRSVFPSTTAVALTSLASGAWPAEHGITGWHTYFPEHRRVVMPLLFRERFTEVPCGDLGLALEDLTTVKSQLPTYVRQTQSLLPRFIYQGAYARWSRGETETVPFRSLHQATRKVISRVRSALGPTFTYLYLTTVDSLSHHHGTMSHQVATEIRRIDAALAQMRETLPDRARMIVTADHGLVDIPEERRIIIGHDHPLVEDLEVPPTGEGRTPVFHVRAGRTDSFIRRFAESDLSKHFVLMESTELAQAGVLGAENRSEAARLHWGEFAAIATEPAVLEFVAAGGEPLGHAASHGGLHPDEIRVPLFLA